MKSNHILIFILLLSPLIISSQDVEQALYCGSDYVNEEIFRKDRKQLDRFNDINKEWEKWALAQTNISQRSANQIMLPIVFHDLGSAGIYSNAALLQNVVDELNVNFQDQTNIQFCLATIDHFGSEVITSQATFPIPSGILNKDNQDEIDLLSDIIQSTGKFPTHEYINIYVVDDISNPTAGFAYGPQAHGELFDGIYLESLYLSQYDQNNNMVVLTHEMGHYLGLLHTFGRCQNPIFEECSCTNNNCLLDGDMVCDTPPDFSTVDQPSCGAMNTCSTDAMPLYNLAGDQLNPFASDFGTNTVDIDANDLTNNYMDYGTFTCKLSFTPGQAQRMCFMTDPDIGPRNSLLTAACNINCIYVHSCPISIDEITPTTEILAIDYPNTIVLNGASVAYTFMGRTQNCLTIDSYSWQVTNRDTDEVLAQSSNTMELTATFFETGNYQVAFTVAVESDPACNKTTVLHIKVVDPPVNEGNCIDINWDDFDRIEYTNGWVYNDDSPSSGMRDATSSGPIYVTSPNDVQNSSSFAIINGTIPNTDPTFGGMATPNGIDKIFRVGKVIDGSNENPLPLANANYVEYTFTPTEENSIIRVWYLGVMENPTANLYPFLPNSFANPSINISNGFGVVMSHSYRGFLEGNMHNSSSLNGTMYNSFYFNQMDNSNDNVEVPRSEFAINGQNNYIKTDEWGYYDIDVSHFTCQELPVSLTFYARTNSAVDALFHSYAYFGLQCLPSVPASPIDFNFPNVYVDCAPTSDPELEEGKTCYTFNYEGYEQLIAYNHGKLPKFQNKFSQASSYDGQNFSDFTFLSGNQVSAFGPTFEFQLCTESNAEPIQYFIVRLETPCKIYEDTIVFHQGSTPLIDPCPNLHIDSIRGGLIPDDVDLEILLCDSTEVVMGPPCWWEPGMFIEYKWQVNLGTWRDIPNGNTDTLMITKVSQLIQPAYATCLKLRRVAKFADPYCGTEVWIPSEENYRITSLTALTPRIRTTLANDVCLGEEVNLYVEILTFANNTSCVVDSFLNDLTYHLLNENGDTIVGTFKDDDGNVLAANVSTFSYNYWNRDYQDINISFENTNSTSYSVKSMISGTAYGCEYEKNRTTQILVKPSAIGGTIEHVACSDPIEFNTVNLDNNSGFGYNWSYSYDDISFIDFPNSNSAGFTVPSTFNFTDEIIFISRSAFGSQECTDTAYSNTLEIYTNSSYSETFDSTTCQGEGYSIVVNGTTYDESNPSGIETIINSGSTGCDSIITIDLSYIDCSCAPIVLDTTYNGCSADGFNIMVNGATYNESNPNGTETISGGSFNGCDSIINVSMVFNALSVGILDSITCQGGGYSIVVNGTTYDESNPSGSETIVNGGVNGCDSIITIDLTYIGCSCPPVIFDTTYTGCTLDGFSSTVNGVVYNEANPSGTETIAGGSSNGCDSIININFSFNSVYDVFIYDTTCIVGDTGSNSMLWLSSTGCDSLVTTITALRNPLTIDISPSFASIVLGASIELEVIGSPGSILWTPSDFLSCSTCSEVVSTPESDITYIVSVETSECIAYDTVVIEVNEFGVFIPNAFTPNGDGLNDYFRIKAQNNIELQFLEIYNRWGELLFASTDIEQGWDGFFKGQKQPTDTYAYHLSVQDEKGRTTEFNGKFSLLR